MADQGSRFWPNLLQQRQTNGSKAIRTSESEMYRRFYSSFAMPTLSSIVDREPVIIIPGRTRSAGIGRGAIFNLEYSPSGSCVVSTTEDGKLIFYDPFTYRMIKEVARAHRDAVNLVRFLNEYKFASCSDDCLIKIWDRRNLTEPIKELAGHDYWIKNLEYVPQEDVLLSSGYDGEVIQWTNPDLLNRHNPAKHILKLNSLVRMKLSHDQSKMIVTSSDGYILLIHDIDLDSFAEDLKSFNSDLYYMMQRRDSSLGLDMGSWHHRLFTSERNRVEIISDFPEGDDPATITSLDVHPQNYNIVTRNITRADDTEWTTVHDIQRMDSPLELVPLEVSQNSLIYDMIRSADVWHNGSSPRVTPPPPRSPPSPPVEANDSDDEDDEVTDETEDEETPSRFIDIHGIVRQSSELQNNNDESNTPVVIISHPNRGPGSSQFLHNGTDFKVVDRQNPPMIYKNRPRLTHYLQELNVGKGIIKELAFSPNGRVICSPYNKGFRILAFNENCQDTGRALRQVSENAPQPLVALSSNEGHPDTCVTVRFSPRSMQIASGCLAGRVCFYQPVL